MPAVTVIPAREWQVYQRRRRPGAATVRLYGYRSRWLLSFSAAAWRQLGEPAAVVFLTDRAEGLVGFRPAARGERNAYAVTGPQHAVAATMLARFMGDPDPGTYELLAAAGGLPPRIALKSKATPPPARAPRT